MLLTLKMRVRITRLEPVMSKQSEAVKNWRRRFRERVRLSLGGKCVCCGYEKCPIALEAHHIDPSGKDFTFADIRANPIALEKLRVELAKCALVCSNCHSEIHYGFRDGPSTSSFDEAIFSSVILEMNAERNHGKFKKGHPVRRKPIHAMIV